MTSTHVAALIFTAVFVVLFTRVTVTGHRVTAVAVRWPAFIAIAMCIGVLITQ